MIQQKLPPVSSESSEQVVSEIENLLKKHGGYSADQIRRFVKALQNEKLNRVLGCVFGGMIGDALGAYCEFRKEIPLQTLNQAMNMPGGGTFKGILPGQYTDDNELAYHLLMGLNSLDEKKDFKIQKFQILKKIGLQYIRWTQSSPFDIGNTCSAAIDILKSNNSLLVSEHITESQKQMKQILNQILEENKERESNGSLMRITPMAAFYSLLQLDFQGKEESDFIFNEIKLTHPNLRLIKAGFNWVYFLTKLINRQTNHPQEFKNIIETAKSFSISNDIQSWFAEAQKPQNQSMTAAHNMGWAKIAWSYGLKFLIQLSEGKKYLNDKNLYKDWIRWVIGRAGDTDTNAAISGGLIGAVIGFKRLPLEYLKKLFELDYEKTANKKSRISRPAEYQPSNFLRILLDLIDKCTAYNHLHHKAKKQNI